MQSTAKDVTIYIQEAPAERQEALTRLRDLCRATLTGFEESPRARRIVLIAFLLASPFALILMLAGGLFGALGVLIAPQIAWALFTWLGA